jgi:N,N'-diacetyllegionaminate synthase
MQGGKGMSIYIIAEVGVNHNGSLATAKELAEAAKEAGADCVKFQTFKAEKLVSRSARKAAYQEGTTGEGTQADMLKQLELSYDAFRELKAHCDRIGIQFLSTPFDPDSIAFLDTMDMPFWKVPSGEVTNAPYLAAIGKTGKPVVLSTGMCTLEEVGAAIRVLRENGSGEIRLLQCNTEYPTPFEDVNLRAMQTMREEFGLETGYSDHTRGIEAPIAAAALGAGIIEKHFTLDRNMEGPDHKASLEPGELAAMVQAIRHIELALGTGVKTPSPSEQKNIAAARKSLVAARAIRQGETLTAENLAVKRPGTGISPMRWDEVIGTKAVRDFEEDELIEL